MSLMRSQRFLPLFITQFAGAFNDNMLKNALVMLITERLAAQSGMSAQVLVMVAGAIFIAPYFLFSVTAGELADKYDRARLTRIIKLAEIVIMALATVGFLMENMWFLIVVLFAMGVQSTFFGPIKYALLPQHLRDHELLTGNSFIEAGTFLAILLGTIMGSFLILGDNGATIVSASLLGIAVIGYASSRSIPVASPPDPSLSLSKNIWRASMQIVQFSREDTVVFRCILGISWFWLVGATYLSMFPPFIKEVLHAETKEVGTLFLSCFVVGVGTGSLLCNVMMRGELHTKYTSWAALAMALFGLDFYLAIQLIEAPQANMVLSASQFLSGFHGWRVVVDLLLFSAGAGIFIVPLYAVMQHRSAVEHRARIIAANNIINAVFMVGSALIVIVLLQLGLTMLDIFLWLAISNMVMAFYCRGLGKTQ